MDLSMHFSSLYRFGDHLEDKARSKLSHVPLLYALFGGIGIVLFWRGVWYSADAMMGYFVVTSGNLPDTHFSQMPWWDGPLSLLIGSTLLLTIGLFVTSFIGESIIISGLKNEKKLTEKTEVELRMESENLKKMYRKIYTIDNRLRRMEKGRITSTKITRGKSPLK